MNHHLLCTIIVAALAVACDRPARPWPGSTSATTSDESTTQGGDSESTTSAGQDGASEASDGPSWGSTSPTTTTGASWGTTTAGTTAEPAEACEGQPCVETADCAEGLICVGAAPTCLAVCFLGDAAACDGQPERCGRVGAVPLCTPPVLKQPDDQGKCVAVE